jgi:hypothetical protein
MNNELQELFRLLRRNGVMPAGELLSQLQRVRPTMSRAFLANLLKKASQQIVRGGSGRRTSYALRRPIRQILPAIPVYAVDETGRVDVAGELVALEQGGFYYALPTRFPWPLEDGMQDGWFEGLPYMFDGMRPQGFLGRSFAAHHHVTLQIEADPTTWSDDDALYALSIYGGDTSGNFILGDQALRVFRQSQAQGTQLVTEYDTYDAYDEYVNSFAAGEFPKFTCFREYQGQHHHVIVKFSGDSSSPEVQRWADLLICEHLALEVLRETNHIRSSASRIIQNQQRTFLEVERFDRIGKFGRSAFCSWGAINGAMFGLDQLSWDVAAGKMLAAGLIDAANADSILTLYYFGKLIANSDMHSGNLAFQIDDQSEKPMFKVSPAYDMLPMLYAPVRGVELPRREFKPELPLLDNKAWRTAAVLATMFWERASEDQRVSDDFRRICKENLVILRNAIEQFS